MSKSLYTTIIETTPPTTETVGVVGQWYFDSTAMQLYICTEATESAYTWQPQVSSLQMQDYVDDMLADLAQSMAGV